MLHDTPFWRLVWKEYRTQRSLWLAMVIATPVLQAVVLLLDWLGRNSRPLVMSDGLANGLMAVGFVTSVIYVLGCAATIFSVEHETGVFDFQRVLPTNLPRVFWAKVGFAFVSGVLLTVLLLTVTRCGIWLMTVFFTGFWNSPAGGSWFGTYGLLYMSEIFVWSILASLLIRHPLWGVIGAIALQSLMMQVVLPRLSSGSSGDGFFLKSEDHRYLLSRLVVLALLLVADVVLGKYWFEDRLRLPRWRFRWKPDFAPSYASAIELPPYAGQRQIGWSRLLWLSWRDGRWVMAGGVAWYGYNFLTLRHPNDWEVLILISCINSFVFGLFVFAPEQWGGRFRFLAEHGCSPRIAWLCRQVLWLPPLILMCVGTTWMRTLENDSHSHSFEKIVFDVMMAAIWPLIGFSAGQLAAMLIRSTSVAIATAFVMAVTGCVWGTLMASWLAPVWWSVGSLPVIGLFVTWLKANDWVEERRDRAARWRTEFGLGVPMLLLLIVTATYRVIQIPVVTLPPEWDETPQVLARLTPAEKETLAIYRRALAEIEAGETHIDTYKVRAERLRREHPDWTGRQIHVETFEGFHRDWSKQHSAVVPLLRQAHTMAPVPIALLEGESEARANEWNLTRTSKLPWLMYRQAEQSLRDGELDQAWDDIEVAFELQRRFDLRAALLRGLFDHGMGEVTEGYLLLTVTKWGRHNEQTRERVLKAIRKLEEIVAQTGISRRKIHHDLIEAQSALNADERWRIEVGRRSDALRWGAELAPNVRWRLFNIFPWERWRARRVLRLQAAGDLIALESLQSQFRANATPVIGSQRLSTPGKAVPRIEDRERLSLDVWIHNLHLIRNTTMLGPSRTWDTELMAGNMFWQRADSFQATLLLLALADFHREHKRYPESLAELAPTYFAEVPRDPKTVGPFVYFPQGVPEDLTVGAEEQGDLQIVARKETPFLVTTNGSARVQSRQQADGTWSFMDHIGMPIELSAAVRRYDLRIWPAEEP